MLAALIIGACLFAFYAGLRVAADDKFPAIPVALMCLCVVLALRA